MPRKSTRYHRNIKKRRHIEIVAGDNSEEQDESNADNRNEEKNWHH